MQNRKVAAILCIAIVFSSFFTYYAFSPDLTFDTVLEQGSLTEDSSYVVFRDGSDYHAKNGRTGEITSSTNASALINGLIDNFTCITIKTEVGWNSIISLTHSILIPNATRYLSFVGEARAGFLQLADSANCDLFQVNEACHWLTWRNLAIHGNDEEQTGTQHGIHFLDGASATSDFVIEECAITDFTGSPIYAEGVVSASYIKGNYIEDSQGAAIRIGAMHGTEISHNLLWNCSYGIQVESTARQRQDNRFIGNIIHDMSSYGIFLNTTHNNIVSKNRVSSCEVGIFINIMNYGEISENWVHTIDDDGIDMYSLQFCVIRDNQVYGASQETNDTYVGIQMGAIGSGECHSNLVSGNLATNSNWGLKTAYGFFLAGDNNLVTDSFFTGSDIPMSWTGSGNEVHSCFNGTTYIT